MSNTFKNEGFQPLTKKSYITVGIFSTYLFCTGLFIVFSFLILLYPDSQVDMGFGQFPNLGVALINVVDLFRRPLYIATVVFFLIWEYRAFKNLSALKAQNLEFSPGWAVGWWFIPIANLFKPFQVMREIWNESDPEYDADLGFLSTSSTAPTIMGLWWAFFLIFNILSNITSRLEDMDTFAVMLTISSLFGIVAGGLLIRIILDINKRQKLRFERLGSQTQMHLPPPPPSDFNLRG